MPQTCLLRAQCDDSIRRFLFPEDFIGNGMILEHATPASPASAENRESDFSLSQTSYRQSLINDVPLKEYKAIKPLVRLDPIFRKQKKIVRFDCPIEKVRIFGPESKVSPLSESVSNSLDYDKQDSVQRCTPRRGISSAIHWEMQCPGVVPKCQHYSNVVNLQHVKILSGVTLEGIVLVANIAFEKRVGAKFTFDNWYTTSEVACDFAGKACTSKRNGEKDWDLFRFKIELNNKNIKPFEKKLRLCVYYGVEEKEYWDNNYGQNYTVRLYRAEELRARNATRSS